MNRLTTLATLTATAAAAALLAAVPAADAGVTRTFSSGLGCVQAYDMEGATSHGDNGGFFNDSAAGFRTAVCPLDQATPWMLGAAAVVEVNDLSYTGDVQCRIVASSSSWTIWGNPQSSSGSNPAAQRLNVELSFAEHQLANAHIMCWLPPSYLGNRSGIRRFEGSMRSVL